MHVVDAIGVCPVREDTEMLAAAAAEKAPGRALDLGTGTGYVAVYLALRGFDAIHLASAEAAADDELYVLAADRDLLVAARRLGLATLSLPG